MSQAAACYACTVCQVCINGVVAMCFDFAGLGRLEPSSWYIDLGLEEVIKSDLFGNPAWVEAWKRRPLGAAAKVPGSYWCASEYARLCSKLDCDILDGKHGMFELHLDWVQPWSSTLHSTGILGISCSSLSDEDRSKDFNIVPLAVFPGPDQPKSIDVMLQRTVASFERLVTSGMALSDGEVLIPLLDCMSADGPASNKVSKAMGANSYHLCLDCNFKGCQYFNSEKNSSTIYYKGYYEKALQGRASE